MNRDARPDVLNKSTHSANVKTCGPPRQSQDRSKDSAMHTANPEDIKTANFTSRGDKSYLASLRKLQEGVLRDGEIRSSVLRSATFTMSPRSLFTNGDLRRNLYVLGLPFDLTKSEFSKIFEPHGTVTHAVILATLDSASRRRGFVVMSTNQEAKVAMDALLRTQIKGHTLDVSWAVVQRSQGFLDGGDRTMMLAVSAPISEPEGPHPIPAGTVDHTNNQWGLTHMTTSKLLVSNLSTILFTQVPDLHPLFYPFGPIKDIKILESSSGSLDRTITAMVEYVNMSSAQEAKEALQVQSYAGHTIEVHYVCDAGTPTQTRSPFFSGSPLLHGNFPDLGLNPFALPFNISSRFSMGDHMYNSLYDATFQSGLPSDTPLAPQPLPAHMRPYVLAKDISRSSSATSST
ncbi:hypothetical protein JVU11DRAFT_9979 [Chiua virens]|nr:hypothetical protein JVU11DRAFT_9979 [Chiua virens]